MSIESEPKRTKKRRFYQGYYIPKNPEKYVGDLTKIRFMSSWELQTHQFFDNNQKILKWSSEGIVVPYLNPLDKKMHRYYIDYWIEYTDANGKLCRDLIEVKPKNQTKTSRAKNPRTKLYEDARYAINIAKWTAAKKFAAEHGWNFRILTEEQVFK